MTFACFISTACISTSQMCLLKSYVPPSMLAVLVRLQDQGGDGDENDDHDDDYDGGSGYDDDEDDDDEG